MEWSPINTAPARVQQIAAMFRRETSAAFHICIGDNGEHYCIGKHEGEMYWLEIPSLAMSAG